MDSRNPPVLRPEHPTPRPLALLAQEFGLEHTGSLDGVEVTGVTLSTGDLRPGDLYAGIQGAHSHGAQFASRAAEQGAVALLTDPAGAELAAGSGLPVLLVDDPRAALGEVSAWVYRTGADSANLPLLFATTGTNGKTSTSYLLEGILRQLGLVTGLSSTAERHVGDLTVVSRLTTPEASEMHALLARMREGGVRAVAVEVSAQALTWRRVDGLVFDVVAFTNLSHDHLDDYADMEEYFRAKLELFEPEHGRRGVVCLDTSWGRRVVDESRIPVTTVATRGHASDEDYDAAQWTVEILEESAAYSEFRLTGPDGRALVTREPLIGWHMAANAALAIVMLVEAGFELEAIGAALDADGGIRAYLPGRTERVSGERGPSVYVDFGHSPDAFENTLGAVRRFTPGRTIMVFGADGDRDATKRHEMARVAAELSDVLVITDHHPRFEDPASIRATLLDGARLAEHQPEETYEVSPPEEAIRKAVSLAKEGDSILWAGPGHQDYRDIRGVRTPYSARELARAALHEAGWA
ncbi:UDP-N-acetylmuramoyl-L-alanyl-D-glutamate--2,6-diaminopimelate ligase [Pseudolysinimonas kribbensis]|uniref:UDP-N-acetylmuramyl-tripeptide synthetase n=1 Tax=Pseudolysinimonas kribbensis TaxID=433641 RepID=A0ABQ6K1R7_9MICO|nr:UDP-N-acetylmuramoyl-L-alanyl-D-glutamate--2,6-diaminopimelate ligase [Pseudolysinimonas kribbensis]GMA93384.1 UDP-N-acetylmuramoyl-L-alanyl-D-glutamate--2,6-diaminopimelate ligase [Pseudolysinimonas kribbensis]